MSGKIQQRHSLDAVVRRLRRLAKEWPAGAVLICRIDSPNTITLYDRHPEEGGRPVESFAIRADSTDGETPNAELCNAPTKTSND